MLPASLVYFSGMRVGWDELIPKWDNPFPTYDPYTRTLVYLLESRSPLRFMGTGSLSAKR